EVPRGANLVLFGASSASNLCLWCGVSLAFVGVCLNGATPQGTKARRYALALLVVLAFQMLLHGAVDIRELQERIPYDRWWHVLSGLSAERAWLRNTRDMGFPQPLWLDVVLDHAIFFVAYLGLLLYLANLRALALYVGRPR